VNTSLQVGGAIGLAVLVTLSTGRTDDLRAEGDSTASALVGGYHYAFIVAAALVVAALVVTLTVLRRGGPTAVEDVETAESEHVEHATPAYELAA
jgi:hypothetical protein